MTNTINKSHWLKDIASELTTRYYKVYDVLNKAPDVDEDDIIAFIAVFLATLKASDDDYYPLILMLADKIDVKFDGKKE